MSLRQVLIDALLTDDSNTRKEDHRAIKYYESLNENQKHHIDMILISLCGYGLNTLIKKGRNEKVK